MFYGYFEYLYLIDIVKFKYYDYLFIFDYYFYN